MPVDPATGSVTGYAIAYPFTFPVQNHYLHTLQRRAPDYISTDYRLTLLSGPPGGQAGLMKVRVDPAGGHNRGGPTGAHSVIYQWTPGVSGEWVVDWVNRRLIDGSNFTPQVGQAGWVALGGTDEHGTEWTQESFESEITMPAGWSCIAGPEYFGPTITDYLGASDNKPTLPPQPRPRPVAPGSYVAWSAINPETSGYVRIGSPDPGVDVEVYAKPDGDDYLSTDESRLQLLSTANQTFVYLPANHAYLVKTISATKPTAAVELSYSDPRSGLYTAPVDAVPVDLAWTPSAHSGGLPISGYSAHYRDATGKRARTRVRADARSVQVTAAVGTVAWLVANSSAGASEPSQARRII